MAAYTETIPKTGFLIKKFRSSQNGFNCFNYLKLKQSHFCPTGEKLFRLFSSPTFYFFQNSIYEVLIKVAFVDVLNCNKTCQQEQVIKIHDKFFFSTCKLLYEQFFYIYVCSLPKGVVAINLEKSFFYKKLV